MVVCATGHASLASIVLILLILWGSLEGQDKGIGSSMYSEKSSTINICSSNSLSQNQNSGLNVGKSYKL